MDPDRDTEIRQREQMGGRIERQLRQVGRSLAAQRRCSLTYLERVADRVAERLIHVCQHAHDVALGVVP